MYVHMYLHIHIDIEEQASLQSIKYSRSTYCVGVARGKRRTMVSVRRHWHVSTIRRIIATPYTTFEYANVRTHALYAWFPLNSAGELYCN